MTKYTLAEVLDTNYVKWQLVKHFRDHDYLDSDLADFIFDELYNSSLAKTAEQYNKMANMPPDYTGNQSVDFISAINHYQSKLQATETEA